LIFDKEGNLYGTTPDGGSYDVGTIFELSPDPSGWTFTVIDNFCPQYGCPDGGGPLAGLVQDRERGLVGTARAGLYDQGVVFKLIPGSDGWDESVLYSFGSRSHDGSVPMDAPVFDTHGDIYGTTYRGGGQDEGTVFELERARGDGRTERLLYSFCPDGFPCKDGAGPIAAVVLDRAGNLYGTTAGGGAPCSGEFCGTVFRLTRDKRRRWVHSVLYGFLRPEEGFEPITGVVLGKSGALYGTTATGGNGPCYNGCGVVYKLSPAFGGRWKYAVLHKFGSQSQSPPDGTLILDAKGNLYGTALSVVYEITP
jgi:uncharacterized repeat protein (TIGR03803 family)